jgi:hypothetical protein
VGPQTVDEDNYADTDGNAGNVEENQA